VFADGDRGDNFPDGAGAALARTRQARLAARCTTPLVPIGRRGFRCLAAPARRARMNAGGGVHRPCLSRITTFAPSLHGGAFLLWLSRAPRLARHLDDLARCGALAQDEYAVGGSQLPLLA